MGDRIGDFLVNIGAMTPEQVVKVLDLQGKGDKRIFGEIALSLGFLNDDAIKRYVDYVDTQRKAGHPPEAPPA